MAGRVQSCGFKDLLSTSLKLAWKPTKAANEWKAVRVSMIVSGRVTVNLGGCQYYGSFWVP